MSKEGWWSVGIFTLLVVVFYAFMLGYDQGYAKATPPREVSKVGVERGLITVYSDGRVIWEEFPSCGSFFYVSPQFSEGDGIGVIYRGNN